MNNPSQSRTRCARFSVPIGSWLRLSALAVAPALALSCGAGTSVAPPPVAPPVAPPEPAIGGVPVIEGEIDPFVRAAEAYMDSLRLLANIPFEPDYGATRTSLALLADAIQDIPVVPQVSTKEAADLMRKRTAQSRFNVQPVQSAKHVLEIAEGAFMLAARTGYGNAASMQSHLQNLHSAIAQLDERKPISSQRDPLITAFQAAASILADMEHALSSPPGRAR
jgi:hypothetical protein